MHGFTGELDFLSIDIDGNDYWLWEALTACSPRVVALEYNWLFGPERSVTIPYDPQFRLDAVATRALSRRLARRAHASRAAQGLPPGCVERVNAFFVRNDVVTVDSRD